MAARTVNILIEQGANYSQTFDMVASNGINVASGSLVVGTWYYVNGYSYVTHNGANYSNGQAFQAVNTTYTAYGTGTVETLVAKDLTNYTVAATIKTNYTDTVALQTFTVSVPTPSNGKVTCTLTATQTGALSVQSTGAPATAYYDVLLTDGSGNKTRAVMGAATITPRVT